MKRLLYLCLFLFNVLVAQSQDISDFPEVEATFKGGPAALQKYISKNVQYPQYAIDHNIQGKVYASFVIEIDGSISNIRIERGIHPTLDNEAKRLIANMPRWKPGKMKGKKCRTRARLPINFALSD